MLTIWKNVCACHTKALLWLALCAAIEIGIANLSELFFLDFVHGNPHRSQTNAVIMMLIFTPLLGAIVSILVLAVLAIPLALQAGITFAIFPLCENRAYIGALLSIPLSALFLLYCFDYFTPIDFNIAINDQDVWVPYQQGLTLHRYIVAIYCQSVISIIITLFIYAKKLGKRGKHIRSVLIMGSAVVGSIQGYYMAKAQFQFL